MRIIPPQQMRGFRRWCRTCKKNLARPKEKTCGKCHMKELREAGGGGLAALLLSATRTGAVKMNAFSRDARMVRSTDIQRLQERFGKTLV